jgi:6-phosphogluconolactonase/glucosamine-6-phosphate isomerase/deaminase
VNTQINIYKDYNTLSFCTAKEIIAVVKMKPEAVLCLAAGNTPALAYNMLTQQAIAEKVDFSRCNFIGLDEWVGIPPENEGSCHYFLQQHIFKPLNISRSNIHLFNALSTDLRGAAGGARRPLAHLALIALSRDTRSGASPAFHRAGRGPGEQAVRE